MCKKSYPCDVRDENGNCSCPFDADMDSSGFACRNYCGVGVDDCETESNDDYYENDDDCSEIDFNPYMGCYEMESCEMEGWDE